MKENAYPPPPIIYLSARSLTGGAVWVGLGGAVVVFYHSNSRVTDTVRMPQFKTLSSAEHWMDTSIFPLRCLGMFPLRHAGASPPSLPVALSYSPASQQTRVRTGGNNQRPADTRTVTATREAEQASCAPELQVRLWDFPSPSCCSGVCFIYDVPLLKANDHGRCPHPVPEGALFGLTLREVAEIRIIHLPSHS